jgi:hypothetical protein
MDHPLPAPADSASSAPAFVELSGLLSIGAPVPAVLLRVAELVKETVGQVQEASVTRLLTDGPATVALTGALARELDGVQYELHDGPSLDAARFGRTVVVDSTCGPSRYPGFTEAARRHQVRHVVSIGLPVLAGPRLALTLYRRAGPPFDDTSLGLAAAFANYAWAGVAQAVYPSSSPAGLRLHRAVRSRAAVDRAVLRLVDGQHYSRDTALGQLIAWSQDLELPAAEVARSLGEEPRN